MVGHAALYPLELWVAGRKLMIGGIASLGVAPEARRQGAAHALLERLHHELESQNAGLALLYKSMGRADEAERTIREMLQSSPSPLTIARSGSAGVEGTLWTCTDPDSVS